MGRSDPRSFVKKAGSSRRLRRRFLPIAIAAASVVAAAGCVAPPPLPDRAGPAPTPEEVLAVFARDRDGFKTMVAEVSGNFEKGSFSGKLFVDRDRRLFHLYAWKLGGTLAVFDLAVRDDEMRLYVPRSGRMLVASIAGDGAEEGAGRVPLEVLFRTLFKPRGPVERWVTFEHDGPLVTETRDGRPAIRYRLAPRTLALEREVLLARDLAPALVVTYTNPIAAPGGRVWPTALSVRRPGEPDEKAFSLVLDTVDFDAPIGERKFDLRVPPDTRRVSGFAELGAD